MICDIFKNNIVGDIFQNFCEMGKNQSTEQHHLPIFWVEYVLSERKKDIYKISAQTFFQSEIWGHNWSKNIILDNYRWKL